MVKTYKKYVYLIKLSNTTNIIPSGYILKAFQEYEKYVYGISIKHCTVTSSYCNCIRTTNKKDQKIKIVTFRQYDLLLKLITLLGISPYVQIFSLYLPIYKFS